MVSLSSRTSEMLFCIIKKVKMRIFFDQVVKRRRQINRTAMGFRNVRQHDMCVVGFFLFRVVAFEM